MSQPLVLVSNPVLPGTASVTIPTGTTLQRPSTLTAGMLDLTPVSRRQVK